MSRADAADIVLARNSSHEQWITREVTRAVQSAEQAATPTDEDSHSTNSDQADSATDKSQVAAIAALTSQIAELKDLLVARQNKQEDEAQPAVAKPVYRYFGKPSASISEQPGELHQATNHFILHPDVPCGAKLYYLSMSSVAVGLQIMGILALLSSVEAMSVDEILSKYQAMQSLDYFMHILLCILVACTVHAECDQSNICELQVEQACTSEDAAVAATARKWAAPLVLVQKLRQFALVPLTVATAPILGITQELDALDVALNVMAILFVFDLDDLAFAALLSRPQRQYLEGVQITLAPRDVKRMTPLTLVTLALAFFASFFPIVLCDPNAIYASAAANEKFAGFWRDGEPVKTLTALSVISFTLVYAFELVFSLAFGGECCRKGAPMRRTRLALGAWQLLCASSALFCGFYFGHIMGQLSTPSS